LLSFDLSGKELWKKPVEEVQSFNLLTSKNDIFLLQQAKDKYDEGGFSLLSYNSLDGVPYEKLNLYDKEGNPLKVIGFANDPVTGNPFISGIILKDRHYRAPYIPKKMAGANYNGVFTIDVSGHTKNDIKQVFSYWTDGSKKPGISKSGYVKAAKSYPLINNTFRDFNGNTYFSGNEIIKKPKIGSIIAIVVTSPTIMLPIFILAATGTTKCKITDVAILKLEKNGSLNFENEVPCMNSKYYRGVNFYLNNFLSDRSFYNVDNVESKTSYMIVDDSKNIMIYNATKKKIVRTVPHKDGKILTNIYPAKEGHIMVVERNKKEKYTKLSIEALN
jgi:hypothetical protein